MSHLESVEHPPLVKGEKTEWSPGVKWILGLILSLLVLSPAILGVYWELLLTK